MRQISPVNLFTHSYNHNVEVKFSGGVSEVFSFST
jgi:hypothetical protein